MDDLDIVGRIDQAAPAPAQPVTTVDHINAALAGVSPQQGRAAALSQAVADARRKFEARGAGQQLGEFAEPMIPFSQIPGISPTQKWKEMVGESQKRFDAGNYTDQDLGRLAYQHVRDEAEKGQGFGRKVLGAAGHAAGMIGEAVLTGGVGELIPGASRAAGAARLAATTAAMPSLYGEAANQRAQAQGGSPYDVQNMGPAFAQGMILNKILGSMGKAGETLVSGKTLMGGIENAYLRNVARLGVGAVQFPAEQQIADNVTSTADLLLPEAYQFKTKYGVLGELVNGSKGEAGQKFAMQAVMGAIFKAVHAPGAEADRKAAFAAELERYNARLESLSRRGMSSQRVFDSATGDMGQERADEVAQLTKQTPAGPQPAPEATPSEPQPAAGAPQPDTIAPPEGTSTPPTAPGASPAIAPAEQPAAQGGERTTALSPPPAAPAPPPVGAAPSKKLLKLLVDGGFAGSQAEAAAALAKLPPEMVEAVRAQFEGKPAPAPSPAVKKGGATYKQVEVEGPFVHPDMEAGGPRLLAEMRAAPEYESIAKSVPEGSKPIGRPNDAFVFETPDNTIVRVGRASEARPDIPQMIQPLSVQQHGRFKVEVLPKVERVGDKAYFDQHAAELRDAIEKLGWKATDLHRDNVGEYQGRPVFIDPSGPRPMTPREREQLAEAQARRKAAQEAPPEEAARSSPPEPATPPADVGEMPGSFDPATGRLRSMNQPAAPKRPLTKEERTAKMQAGRNRQIRDQAAEKAGVDVKGDAAALDVTPEMYHRAAEHYLSLDRADVAEHNELLDDAKRALDEYGGAHRLLGAWAAGGKRNAFEDAATIKGIDQAAEQSAKDYPGQYRDVAGDKEHVTDQLFEKLLEGKREVDVAEAYRRAYAEIEAVKEYRDALEDAGKDHTHPEIAEALRSADEAEPRHAPEEEGAPAGPGEADEGNLGAGAADADFAFGANAVDLGAAPTTLVGRLEKLPDLPAGRELTPFEKAIHKEMLAEQAGEPFRSPEQVAKAHGKKESAARATGLAAQGRILAWAGEPEGTSWQKLRDAEKASRAELLKGEADGMGQESREGDLSDKRYKQLLGQAKRGERLNDIERNKLLDRLSMDIAETKFAGGDIKADVELYAKIVEQEANEPAPVRREVGGIPGNPGGGPPQRVTALANRQVADERAARGFTHPQYGNTDPLLRAAKVSDPEVWQKAMSRLGADPSAADKLVAELQQRARTVSAEEEMLLLYKKINTAADFDRAVTAEMQATLGRAAPEEIALRQRRATELMQELDVIDKVAKESGTEAGRAFRLRRLLVAEDYSLHGMLQKAAHAKGRPLTEAERLEVLQLQAKITALQAKLDGMGEKSEAAPQVRVDLKNTKQTFQEQLSRDLFGRRTLVERVLARTGEALNLTRTLITSLDLSAVLRQGGFYTLAHPIRAARAMPEMLRAFASKNASDLARDAIDQRANAGAYKRAGLFIAEPHGALSQMEEAFMSRWVKKVPGVAGSERAYTTFLNRVRADLFDSMVGALGKRGSVSEAEAKVIANFVNVSTGRGSLDTPLGSFEKAAVPLGNIFFSPRYMASRFQLLAGQPLWHGTMNTRAAIAKEYARAALGVAVFYGAAKLALGDDAEITFDPRSTDFGKVKVGTTRLDPLTGMAQITSLLGRIGSGSKITQSGKLQSVRDGKAGHDTAADLVTRFVRGKLAPLPGAAMDVAAGQNVVGEPTTAASVLGNVLVPISIQDIVSAFESQGAGRATAFSLLAIFGMGVQNHKRVGAAPRR